MTDEVKKINGNSFAGFKRAFEIFEKYNDEDYVMCADHDEIFVMVDTELISDDEMSELEEMDWRINTADQGMCRFVSA
jgi:hypothetical protein